MKREARGFDFTDTPDPSGKRGGPALPTRSRKEHPATMPPKQGPQRQLPGVRNEVSPPPPPRRQRSNTMPIIPPVPGSGPTSTSKETSWDVTVPGSGVYRVPASTADEAKQAVVTWFSEAQDDPSQARQLDVMRLQAVPTPKEEGATGGALGGQQQTPTDDMREALFLARERVDSAVKEIVRKKKGGGGYVLYRPNKGKKKPPKELQTFPDRDAAKEAELNRFPPRDPEQLKRARDKMKRKKAKRGKTVRAKDRKATREAIVSSLAQGLTEALFREDEVPGSPWDERLSSLSPAAIASDNRLHGLHRSIEKASIGALGDAHKGMGKSLRGIAKTKMGEHGRETGGKMYVPVHLDVDGSEVGPIHLYIDGGHVRLELSDEARGHIGKLDPDDGNDLRGALMSFQDDHLPKIDGARRAVADRDEYLDKLEDGLDGQLDGMSGVQLHLAKQLIGNKHGRKFR